MLWVNTLLPSRAVHYYHYHMVMLHSDTNIRLACVGLYEAIYIMTLRGNRTHAFHCAIRETSGALPERLWNRID